VVDFLQLTAKHAVATPVNWENGQDVIGHFLSSNTDADDCFGKGGYTVVEAPSEQGKDLPKNYLRYTADPTV
jgi:hypothetical protein